jgi:hypothetical protein
MIRKIAIATVLFCVSFSALADAPKETGFYAGGFGGITKFDDDDLFSGDGIGLDDTDLALGGQFGYKFFKFLAVEARYADLGSYRVTETGIATGTFDVSAVSAHVVGILPLGDNGWELTGQLGVADVSADCDRCDDETAGSIGVGVRYTTNTNITLFLQSDYYFWEETQQREDWDFSILATTAGMQFMF